VDKPTLTHKIRPSLRPEIVRVRLPVLCITVVSAASALPVASFAADVYTEPQLDFRIEHNDNFNLTPAGSPDSSVYGYIADLEALVGIDTPRSETSLRPRVRFQEYPDVDKLERFEGFFDIDSRYRGERSNLYLSGGYSRRDVYNTETPSGDFDPIDPGDPDSPEGGTIVVGETRSEMEIRPSFDVRVTERTSIGAGVEYHTARYDADLGATTKTDYDFGLVNGFVTWAVSPASDFTVGAYASRYEAQDDSVETDAVGGLIGYAYRWSETNGIELSVFNEQNDTTVFFPVRLEESESSWGGDLTAYRKNQLSTWRFTVGRSFFPTGEQGKSQFDEFRLAYDRDLSQRLSFRGVARYDSRSRLGTTGVGNDRDYARVDLSLRWFLTQNWYLGGGYSYVWVDRAQAISDAHNNKLFINFGYRGLSRKPR